MNLEKIKNAKTKTIGKNIDYYKEISSTHIEATRIVNKEGSNGKILIAEMQTGGIGTKGRSWYTGANKNIAMTIILKPSKNIQLLENLTIDIAKCMQKTIYELYGYTLNIKEPNDLILNNKKICGILTTSNTIGDKINYLLISLGFNVNEDKFSEETKNIATSLKREYKKDFSREDIIVRFIEILEEKIKF